MQYSSWGCINTKYRGRTTSSDMLAMLYLMHPKTHSWLPASGWECIWSSLFLMMQREDQDLFQLVGRAMPFGGTGKEPTRTLTWQQAHAHRGLVYHQIQLQLLTCSKNAILYSSPQHVDPHLKPFPWMFERKKKIHFHFRYPYDNENNHVGNDGFVRSSLQNVYKFTEKKISFLWIRCLFRHSTLWPVEIQATAALLAGQTSPKTL